MSLDEETEIDVLKGLMAHPGWDHFVRMCHLEYSDALVVQRLTRQVEQTDIGDELSQHESVRSTLAAQKAVLSMLVWPEQRLAQLSGNQHAEQPQTIVERFKRSVGR